MGDRKESTMVRSLIALLIATAAMLSGCNTMRGFGQDMERGGEKIQQEAQRK
jgi:predicted small secreted protein